MLSSGMRARRILQYLALAMLIAPVGFARAQDAVATPAIDTTIFKDGEVEGREFKFED
ncbi:hypothetical protein [Methylobacterium sp. J-076]|uniref:hypothetical protein n=1 Tax=Methylobacterium sp. J-076 TaxID=2836655 RepID=UPI001FB8A715|nr:hypothetical protein [Methylobacterium sp. J-076]MCJ2013055.1 hypothetical protein [Methylobacterium sp. J-076]